MKSFPYVIKYKKGKDNVVADALSRKNTLLLTRIDINVLGLDEIKELYHYCRKAYSCQVVSDGQNYACHW